MSAAPAAALGYSIVSNLDGNRQITVQCFVAEDESDEVVNAKLDRVFRVIDRQKARYDIVSEDEEMAKEKATLHQLQEDLARVDADFEATQSGLNEEIIKIDAQGQEAFLKGYNDHAASGRRGEYNPSGASKAQLTNIGMAKKNIEDTLKKNEAERDQHRTGVSISIQRYHQAIAERETRIGTLKAMLGG